MILRTGRPSTEEEDAGSAAPSADGQNEEYRYAVIFLDNQMPVLSGLDVVTKLREMGRKDFVVGVTGAFIRSYRHFVKLTVCLGNALLTDQKGYLEAGADQCALLSFLLAMSDSTFSQRANKTGSREEPQGYACNRRQTTKTQAGAARATRATR